MLRAQTFEMKCCNNSKFSKSCSQEPQFQAYIGYTGEDPTVNSVDDLHFVYDAPARITRLINRMPRTFGFGLTEGQIQYYPEYLASGAYYVGNPALADATIREFLPNLAFPAYSASRQTLTDAILANGGPNVARGSLINPSFVRRSIHLRATSSTAGENSIDGVPFSDFPKRGLFDEEGFMEVTNNDGVLGGPSSIQNVGLLPANINASQHLWTYEAKGSGIAIRCDPERTLAGLNKYDVVVKYFQKKYNITRNEAIIKFVGMQDVSNLPWLTFVFLPTTQDSPDPAIFVVSGLYAPPGLKPMWRVAAEETGIRSLSNPSKPLNSYNPTDIAEVFIQAVITPDFVSTTKDPFGRLAGLQNFAMNSDVIFGDMIGPIGTPKSYGDYDSVQCIWEYHGGSYSPEIPYAWWRYTTIDVGNGDTPLFGTSTIPFPTQLLAITGPFYVKSQGVWQAKGYVNPAIGNGPFDVNVNGDTNGDFIPWCTFQENLNYCYYSLLQQTFFDSPVGELNPTGGKLQVLGNYDCTSGKIVTVVGPASGFTGLAVGDQYGLLPNTPLPLTLPNRFPITGPNFVHVDHQYFAAVNCAPTGTNPSLVDPNAPNALVFDFQWIYFDQQTQKWNVISAWPVNETVPNTIPPVFLNGAAQGASAGTAQWRATCMWHVNVPGSMGASSLTDVMTAKQWNYY